MGSQPLTPPGRSIAIAMREPGESQRYEDLETEAPLPQPRAGHGARWLASPARDVRSALRDPVVDILFVAGFFDGISDNWIHATMLWAVAAALAREAARRRRGLDSSIPTSILGGRARGVDPARRMLLGLAGAVVLIVYVWAAGGFDRYTWPVTVVIVIPVGVVVALSWRGPPRARPAPGPLDGFGVLAWGAVFVAAGVLELASLLLQPSLRVSSYAHPTLSYLMDPILSSHVGRSITLLVWLGVGWFLLTSTTEPDQKEREAENPAPEGDDR
jgi:hypothetical protein